MNNVMLRTETTEAVTWPSCCLRCGQDLSNGAPTQSPNQIPIADAEVATIRERWAPLPTDELLAVWVQNNQEEWQAETFQVIGKLLEDRNVVLPPQRSRTPTFGQTIPIATERGASGAASLFNPKSDCGSILRFVRSSREIIRESIEGLAAVVLFLTIVESFLGGAAYDSQYRFNEYGIGASLCLFAVLAGIGKTKRRHSIGVKAKRITKTLWKFSFTSKDVMSAFVQLNQPLVATTRASPPL